MSELFKLLKRRSAKVEHISAEILQYEAEHDKYQKKIIPLVSNTYELGIEIEIERIKNIEHPLGYQVWTSKGDHSLRDNGVEYVSTPIKGPRISFALNQFFDNINSSNQSQPSIL